MGFHLCMAGMWLVLAAVIMSWEWAHPQHRVAGTILGTNFSVAWIAAILGAYNLARWWSGRRRAHGGLSPEEQWLRWRRSRLQGDSRHQEPPDPNFDFTDGPKGADGA